ncbi:MAG: metallophosphoesterase [Tannerella sp.]|jgi:predicted phosphohydrolase|nr:metallophosphoesterase [Tannerella sp.]
MKKYFLISAIIIICQQVVAQEDLAIIHGPYLQNLSSDEVTIVWVTNKEAVSWVELAPDDSTHFYLIERRKFYSAKNGVKLQGRVHSVKLNNLKTATKYRYRVVSQEIIDRQGNFITYGRQVSTTAYRPATFITLDPTKKSVAFTMVNDIHGRSDVLEQMLKLAEPTKQDLVLFNGDMVSSMKSEEDFFNGFMDVGVKTFAQNIPMYYCRGNHETRGVFATMFQDYFSPKSPELYYLVRQGPVCFVVLDCGEDKPDTDVEYYGITDYDYYRTIEAEWLREAIKDKRYTEAPFKVIVCHMPPFRDWHGEAEILEKFVPILNDAKADVMLCGHLHHTSKHEANAAVKFPVLINSNNSYLKGSVEGNKLTLDIYDLDGKRTEGLTVVH